jgi:general secretion pathway protein M
MDALLRYYFGLSPRDQRIALYGGIAAVMLLILAVVLPLQRHVGALEQRVAQKRDDLIWLRSMAPQLVSMQTNAPPPLHESLVVVVDRTARQAGLERALVGSQPSGDGGLNVRLEQTPFDGLVSWVAQLRESYGIRVDSAVIEPAAAPGTVNSTMVLHAR